MAYRLEKAKANRAIPLHFFKEDSIGEFQRVIRELFLGREGQGPEDRVMVKRYLKLTWLDIVGNTEGLLVTLENKKAVRGENSSQPWDHGSPGHSSVGTLSQR